MPVLLPIILQLVQIGVVLAPSLIAAGKLELDLLGGAYLTNAEKTDIDAALEEANTALQNAQPAA